MRMIVIDMDGTLLNAKTEISEENIRAIKAAQKDGIEVVIATGRFYRDAKARCERASIDTYIISSNGSEVHSRDGVQIHCASMDEKDAKSIIEKLESEGYYYEVTVDGAIYSTEKGRERILEEAKKKIDEGDGRGRSYFKSEYELQFNQKGLESVDGMEAIFRRAKGYYKVLGHSFDDAKRSAGIELFKEMDGICLVTSGNHNFEMSSKKASKGDSLEKLASMIGLELQNTMAIGDNYNDVSMFEKVGYSVAMGNANDDIKGRCTSVTLANNENGVAHAIYKFMETFKSAC